jgi:hypothetical protein
LSPKKWKTPPMTVMAATTRFTMRKISEGSIAKAV